MAYTAYRGYVADLHEGMTDGAYKKYAMNRGGLVEPCTAPVRRQMAGVWHGFNEVQPKILADARYTDTPNYLSVRPECRDH